jgi:hypothetical protein
MPLGPIELLEIRFPGNQFRGEIAAALKELVETGTIRIIDILFLTKDQQGTVTMLEINQLDDDDYNAFDPVVSEVTGLLSEDDVRRIASGLEYESSVGVMLFENVWATRFASAVANARGEVLLNERIPRAVIDEVVAALPTA